MYCACVCVLCVYLCVFVCVCVRVCLFVLFVFMIVVYVYVLRVCMNVCTCIRCCCICVAFRRAITGSVAWAREEDISLFDANEGRQGRNRRAPDITTVSLSWYEMDTIYACVVSRTVLLACAFRFG